MIAVSHGMRTDILGCYPAIDPARVHVIHNGIDTGLYRPDHDTAALERIGIDPYRPFALFVGRITRQKGVPHLLRAARSFDPDIQLVLCAGAPDTPETGREFRELFEELDRVRDGVHWIPEMLPRPQVVQLLSHAAVFVCPRSTSRWASSIWRPWPAARPLSHPRSAASPRSWTTDARDCSCRTTPVIRRTSSRASPSR